jgi:hypothetical protein
MQPGESNEVAQFTILGASPHGQKDGVVDMLTMLITTPPVHRTHAPFQSGSHDLPAKTEC